MGIITSLLMNHINPPPIFRKFHGEAIHPQIYVAAWLFGAKVLCHISNIRIGHIIGDLTCIRQQVNYCLISTLHGDDYCTACMQAVEIGWIVFSM